MRALVKRIGSQGHSLVAAADSSHWVVIDSSREHGGFGGGSSPMELLLQAVGGCTGIDVLSTLAKKRVKLDDFEIELDADRAATPPKVFTAIRIVYRFFGEKLEAADLEHAVRLSMEKYCSVSQMLKGSVAFHWSIETFPPREAR